MMRANRCALAFVLAALALLAFHADIRRRAGFIHANNIQTPSLGRQDGARFSSHDCIGGQDGALRLTLCVTR